MTNTTTNPVRYTVDVTPTFENLLPRYDVSVYMKRSGGICGPTGHTVSVDSLADVDVMLGTWQFVRVGEFGPLCSNGFASAPLAQLD